MSFIFDHFFNKNNTGAHSVDGHDYVYTDNYANKEIEFYYYSPPSVEENNQEGYPLLLCVPGLYTKGQNFINKEIRKFAQEEKMIILAPSFNYDEKYFKERKSYQFPAIWSGDALLQMINKLVTKGYNLSRFYLYGFSAGAQFVLRFALWKPSFCVACAAHGSGGKVLPDKPIPVKFLVGIGKLDSGRIPLAEDFYNAAKSFNIDVTLKKYNTGHFLTQNQLFDSLEFFKFHKTYSEKNNPFV